MSVRRIVISIVSLFLIASAVFAPLPWNIALNHETKECAGYWGGDEFVTFELPSGWKAFEYQYSEEFITAETDIGICQVAKNGTNDSVEKACCSQLGYTYVSENVGIRRITPFNLTSQAEMEKFANQGDQISPIGYYVLFFVGLILLFMLVVLFIREIKKE